MLHVCDGNPPWNCKAQLWVQFSYFQFEGLIFISVSFSEYEFPLKEFQETPVLGVLGVPLKVFHVNSYIIYYIT